MRVVEIIRHPGDDERQRLVDFVDQVTASEGTRPLSDHLWLDLNSDAGHGFIAVTVADPTGILAMVQISAANDSSSIEAVIRPDVDDAGRVRDDAVETAVDGFRHDGGGNLFWWIDDADDHDRSLAERIGLMPDRQLFEMRLALPLEQRATVTTRSFIPGVDDQAWITVNNRAFQNHGEQGGWTTATLAGRLTEPWFDPDGFRLHEIDGRLAAFCWTKLHHDRNPVLGEIYVIALDPEFHGRGLGKQLTLAGLDSIAANGVSTAMLYVDAHNKSAVRLYQRLGFAVHRTRQAFSGTIAETPNSQGTR
jgi:mycothiol synthase